MRKCQTHIGGWIRTASAAAIRPGGKKAPAGPFEMRGLRNPPAPTKNSSVVMTLEFLFYPEVCKAPQGWIRTAAEPTTACGGNREARLGQRSDFSRPSQGVAEKSASATCKARRFASRRAKTAAARKAPCGGCSHFVKSSGKITSRTRQCTRSRTLPAAS